MGYERRNEMSQHTICIMGAGSFGRAMRFHLEKKGYEVRVWRRGDDPSEKIRGADTVIYAVPAQSFREVLGLSAPYLQGKLCVNLAKGIELGSLKRLSEVAGEICPDLRYIALSGPSHAEEILESLPANVTVASGDEEALREAQEIFFSDRFRVYTNTDLVGTETGGALKNVIALCTGISDGLGLGDNTRAAIMTRGLAEISRLGVAMGADPITFLGLSGVGDLIVTCTSMHSRNRRCGIMLGKGMPLEEALLRVGEVVEGVTTCRAARDLSLRYGVEMPITSYLYEFLEGRVTLEDALATLLKRSPKAE